MPALGLRLALSPMRMGDGGGIEAPPTPTPSPTPTPTPAPTPTPSPTPTITFLQAAVNNNDLSSYTFAAQNFGTAATDRVIIVGFAAKAGSPMPTGATGVTIGGVTATLIVTESRNNGANTMSSCSSIWAAVVPTGASGDVVVTYSKTMQTVGLAAWRAYDLPSLSPTSTDASDLTVGATLVELNLNPTSTGFAIACALMANGRATFASTATTAGALAISVVSSGTNSTWTGMTEDADNATDQSAAPALGVAASW